MDKELEKENYQDVESILLDKLFDETEEFVWDEAVGKEIW